MLKLITRSRLTATAMDFGACSLRAVQLRNDHGQWRVHHWLNHEVDPPGIDPDPIPYTALLKRAYGLGGFAHHRTRLLIGPPDVEYKMLELPRAILRQSSEELGSSLEYELSGQTAWELSESELATWPIQAEGATRSSAMIVCAKRAGIIERLDAMNQLGLECLSAEILPTAAAWLARGISSSTAEETPLWGMLDLGFRGNRLYLIHGDRPIYARNLQAGGRQLTERLAAALHMDFQTAEQYKRIYGIRQTRRGFRSVIGGISRLSEQALPGVLYAILRDTLETLIEDIERSCRFALGKVDSSTVGPILLVGGGSRLKGLAELLSDKLGIGVYPPNADFFTRCGFHFDAEPEDGTSEGETLSVLAPCVGLAMAEDER